MVGWICLYTLYAGWPHRLPAVSQRWRDEYTRAVRQAAQIECELVEAASKDAIEAVENIAARGGEKRKKNKRLTKVKQRGFASLAELHQPGIVRLHRLKVDRRIPTVNHALSGKWPRQRWPRQSFDPTVFELGRLQRTDPRVVTVIQTLDESWDLTPQKWSSLVHKLPEPISALLPSLTLEKAWEVAVQYVFIFDAVDDRAAILDNLCERCLATQHLWEPYESRNKVYQIFNLAMPPRAYAVTPEHAVRVGRVLLMLEKRVRDTLYHEKSIIQKAYECIKNQISMNKTYTQQGMLDRVKVVDPLFAYISAYVDASNSSGSALSSDTIAWLHNLYCLTTKRETYAADLHTMADVFRAICLSS